MAVIANIYTLGCVVTSAGQINEITASNTDTGIEEIMLSGDGQIDNRMVARLMSRPICTFTTQAVSRALGFVGLSGLAFTSAADLYYQQLAQGGSRNASGSIKVTAGYGLIVPTTLEADQSGARLTYQLMARSNDGTTAPLAVATGQSMPTLSASDQLFVAGPVTINGTALTGIQSIRVDFGLQIVSVNGDGQEYPVFLGVRKRTPAITVRTFDIAALNTLTVGGAAQGATDSTLYLRKLAANGGRVADATAEHVKIAIDDGRFTVGSIDASDDGDAVAEVRISPVFDGTADVIAITAASAIT